MAYLSVRKNKAVRVITGMACFDGFVEIPAKALSAITGKSSLTASFWQFLTIVHPIREPFCMDAAKTGMPKTVTVCGRNRPAGSYFHGMGRFGRIPFPDVDTGFIA